MLSMLHLPGHFFAKFRQFNFSLNCSSPYFEGKRYSLGTPLAPEQVASELSEPDLVQRILPLL
jgi:hypothetical protein